MLPKILAGTFYWYNEQKHIVLAIIWFPAPTNEVTLESSWSMRKKINSVLGKKNVLFIERLPAAQQAYGK